MLDGIRLFRLLVELGRDVRASARGQPGLRPRDAPGGGSGESSRERLLLIVGSGRELAERRRVGWVGGRGLDGHC
jgi:hypothetical protein